MANGNGHGGYRAPADKSFKVSGPGKYSQRTDGQVMSSMPGQDYGQKTADMNAQRTAPMGGQAPVPQPKVVAPDTQQQASAPPYQGGDFGAPTVNPSEPVTAGAPAGPGPGPEVLGGFTPEPGALPTGYVTSILQQLSPGDVTGTLADLAVMARQRGV